MARTVYIDISAKLENWTADSVIAMTNGGEIALVVSAKVKQEARGWLRGRFSRRKGAYHAYILLAILIAIITAPELDNIEVIVIDKDYTGESAQGKVKNEVVPLLKRRQPTFSGKRILFQQVKGTRADRLAREVYRLNNREDRRHITVEEIRAVLEKE
jgi:hypothetical protein